MNSHSNSQVLTTGQVARICHVAPRTVSKWFDSGKLRGYRIPGSRDRRIPMAQLRAFMTAHNMPLNELDGGTCRVMIFAASPPTELIEDMNATQRYEVRMAFNGFEAGMLAEQFRPHVIVLDAGHQDDQAEETCRNIRSTADLQSATVIAAAAGLTDERAKWLCAKGFDGCVPKPPTFQQLQEAIEATTNLAR